MQFLIGFFLKHDKKKENNNNFILSMHLEFLSFFVDYYFGIIIYIILFVFFLKRILNIPTYHCLSLFLAYNFVIKVFLYCDFTNSQLIFKNPRLPAVGPRLKDERRCVAIGTPYAPIPLRDGVFIVQVDLSMNAWCRVRHLVWSPVSLRSAARDSVDEEGKLGGKT